MKTSLKKLSVQGKSLSHRIAKLAESTEGKWITVKGRKVFITDGQSVEDAVSKSLEWAKSKEERIAAQDAEEKPHIDALKSVTKGLALPKAGAEFGKDGYRWSKRGGYIDSTRTKLLDSLKAKGWERGKASHTGSADGNYMGGGDHWTKDGWNLSISSNIGPTKSSNSYNITVEKAKAKA